jgi:hypothetical protein
MEQFTNTNIAYTQTEELAGPVIVTVTLSYDFPLWFGGLVGLDSVELQKSATMASAQIEERP